MSCNISWEQYTQHKANAEAQSGSQNIPEEPNASATGIMHQAQLRLIHCKKKKKKHITVNFSCKEDEKKSSECKITDNVQLINE